MTKEQLEARNKELEIAKENAKSQYLALEGALQNNLYLIQNWDQPAETQEKKLVGKTVKKQVT